MPAPSFLLRRPGSLLLRATAAGLVLAGALSTLAGVSEPSTEPGALRHALPAGGQSPIAVPAPAAPRGATALARLPATAQGTTARPARFAAPGEPPPFAPGGDDLLSSSEDTAPRPRAAATGGQPATPRAPAPLLWLERTTVQIGETAVLHLGTSGLPNACRGADALAGVAITGHRIAWRATAAGQHRLGVVCEGADGVSAAAVTLTVPFPPALSSTEAGRPLMQDGAGLPALHQLGLRGLAAAGAREQDLMVPGDYLQQGRLSLFVIAAAADGAAAAHVLARDGSGRWTDRSAELLDDAQRSACASAVQAIGSDFNRDGRPDVWIVCDGRQLLFLSQPDGRYRRLETPFSLRALQAEARDVDGDGWPDIVTLDTSSAAPRTLLLLGRGDGRFDAGPAQAWGLSMPDQRR